MKSDSKHQPDGLVGVLLSAVGVAGDWPRLFVAEELRSPLAPAGLSQAAPDRRSSPAGLVLVQGKAVVGIRVRKLLSWKSGAI